MDIRMPVLDGIEATRRLAGPGVTDPVRVLVVTTFNLDEYVYEALRAGASGFLLKDALPTDLVNGVRTIARGESLLAPAVTRHLIGHFATRVRASDPAAPGQDHPLAALTRREREVLTHIAAGLSNAEIAGALVISPGDGEDLRLPHSGQAGPARPGPGGGLRLPDRPDLTSRLSCPPGSAATWQGPRYSTVAHSISDMYAQTAPGAAFLIIVFTLCGAATIMFAIRSVRRALRPGGWTATAGSVLLALSIVGLGDLLTVTERLACRMADPGCTATRQIANTGGQLDNALSTFGVLALIVAGVFLSFAMRRAAAWRGWAWPTRWQPLRSRWLLRAADRSHWRSLDRRRGCRHSAADPEGPAGRPRWVVSRKDETGCWITCT